MGVPTKGRYVFITPKMVHTRLRRACTIVPRVVALSSMETRTCPVRRRETVTESVSSPNLAVVTVTFIFIFP